ncbi:MAG: hypothetical protein E7Z89_04770 [Cyanobacteria bacterium SIG28]|nr:hypothetical protein [Cyanobacteria bacterium SIG28]
MGLAASQARLLSLIAKQSNLEYQGQQINNERTVLSQQVTDLYNSLLALDVPTPPSTQEFTKVEYSGDDGATHFTIGTIKPSGEKYLVEIKTEQTGGTLSANYGTSVVEKDENGKILTIQGKDAYTWAEAMAEEPGFDWGKYEQAVRNTYTTGDEANSIDKDDFYVFFVVSDTGVKQPQFAFAEDVNSQDGYAKVYSYQANGQFTHSEQIDECLLEFDTSGRIIKISIPHRDFATGKIVSYQEVPLKASQVTDELAYEDAFAQYEYAMYQYDKKQEEITAQTQVIQQMDRNLELKLTRLDNERTQITTEIEALDKVINDNIEKSYKTFSG